ncbi:hypothetical protein Ciccas_004272 [Cichlidogyrus casuarinus]|uniref:Uncharacterized protein n=1 Tax=Cichlidogyrus casuarinus TaxID=1844966 RepID=A0ABD2QCX6_9PLAT
MGVRVELSLIFVKVGQVDTVNERYQADVFLQSRWREPLLDRTWISPLSSPTSPRRSPVPSSDDCTQRSSSRAAARGCPPNALGRANLPNNLGQKPRFSNNGNNDGSQSNPSTIRRPNPSVQLPSGVSDLIAACFQILFKEFPAKYPGYFTLLSIAVFVHLPWSIRTGDQ